MTFLLAACSGSADDSGVEAPSGESVLVELATTLSTDLFRGVWFAVGEDALWAMGDVETLTGTLVLPEDADPTRWEAEATGTAAWTVRAAVDPDGDAPRVWTWEIGLALERLVLPSGDVAVDGTWSVHHEVYDYQLSRDRFAGSVALDGGPPLEVYFETTGTWSTLNAVEGTIDGLPVSWTNETPDVP